MNNKNEGLIETNFRFPSQKNSHKGKVRDIYEFDNLILMIVTDRISAI